MTPIVFCASLVPCARETSEAEAIWPTRKPLVTDWLRARAVSLYARYVASSAATPATTGEATAGISTFSTTLSKCTPCDPAPTQTAPISPPNSACDELDGSPTSQVSRFHRIAPTSPAKIMPGETSVSSTMPPEIVLATSVDRKAPTTFRTPLMSTAVFGLSAPVAMDVAIAFAVSWNPLVKSKARAVTMTTATRNVMWSIPQCKQARTNSRRTYGKACPRSRRAVGKGPAKPQWRPRRRRTAAPGGRARDRVSGSTIAP